MAIVYDFTSEYEQRLQARFEAAVDRHRTIIESMPVNSPERDAYIEGLADGISA